MSELERMYMKWSEAIWSRDYPRAAAIMAEIQIMLKADSLVQELWPGAWIMPAAMEDLYHD